MNRDGSVLAVLLLLAVPSVAQANAGTPLMWAGAFHLVLGNLIIGSLEGILLAKVFGLSRPKCIGLLILANYLSAWLGGVWIAQTIAHALPMGLHNAWPMLWFMVLVTYVLTLIIEFPFVAIAFRRDPSWLSKAIRGSFLIQSISYVIVFGWYWMASGTSLYTTTNVVELPSISLPEKVLVHFISADDGDVYAGSLREAQWQKVFDLNSLGRNDRLVVQPSAQDGDSWDLVARLETDDREKPDLITVEQQFASVAAPSWRSMSTNDYGPVPKLGDAESSSWEFTAGFWPTGGLHGTEANSGRRVSLALDTPFVAWSVRNATHLPGDKVLFQLGDDQICVYDPEQKQIALLARGRGPIAIIGERAGAAGDRFERNDAPSVPRGPSRSPPKRGV